MTLYKNKYSNESGRAQWWDYGWAVAYFVTICTKNRIHYFGEIINKKRRVDLKKILRLKLALY